MNFVSESALEEKRRLRQEEWERVRKPDDPVVAPEEEYDGRSLYERLKEQKDRKQQEFDEAHKLKNMVRGLDDDEAGFLDFVDQAKLAEEKRKNKEEYDDEAGFLDFVDQAKLAEEKRKNKEECDEIEEYRKAVAKEKEERLLTEAKAISIVPQPKHMKRTTTASIGVTNQTQKNHLNAFVVKRKSMETHESDVKKLKSAQGVAVVPASTSTNLLKCIAVLPGIGCYGNSSDSDTSSDSDDCLKTNKNDYDLCGRPVRSSPTENDE